MSISRKDVEHIAKLARIELSERELATFEKDLSDFDFTFQPSIRKKEIIGKGR